MAAIACRSFAAANVFASVSDSTRAQDVSSLNLVRNSFHGLTVASKKQHRAAFGALKHRKNSHRIQAAEDLPSDVNSETEADDIAVSDVDPSADEALEEILSSSKPEIEFPSSEIKQGLLDTVEGTNRGINASSEARAEITELIAQLEARNPTSAPTEAAELLDGKWVLAYTSFSELYPLLALSYVPLVTVGEISQTIDASAGLLTNTITFSNPLTKSTVATQARYEVRSAKRVQVTFQETVLSPPQLLDNAETPKSVNLFGRQVDLSSAEPILKPVQDAAEAVIRSLSGQPPIKVPFRNEKASSWLLTTYLDEDLRIARGDGGGVFVLVKEGSPFIASL